MLDPSAWKARAAALFGSLALIWAVSLYGLYVDERLVFALALVPRRVDGLPGILSAPLVHGSFAHLLANMGMASRKGTFWPREKGPPFLSCGGRRDERYCRGTSCVARNAWLRVATLSR